MLQSRSQEFFDILCSEHLKTDVEHFLSTISSQQKIFIQDNYVIKFATQNEVDNTVSFSDDVFTEQTHNFPLVYMTGKTPEDQPYMVFEKFDGDAEHFFRDENFTRDESSSFLLQVILGVYSLYTHGKSHGDLNPGNIFYKNYQPQNGDEFLEYNVIINGEPKTIQIKHYNRLWVIGDLEYVSEHDTPLSDEYTPSFFKKWFAQEEYVKLLNPETNSVYATWIYDLAIFMSMIDLYHITKRIVDIDPKLNPVEAISQIIKNEIEHIYKLK